MKTRQTKKSIDALKMQCRILIWIPLSLILIPLFYMALGFDLDNIFMPVRPYGILGVLISIFAIVIIYGIALSMLFKGLILSREIDALKTENESKRNSGFLPILLLIVFFLFLGWKTGMLNLIWKFSGWSQFVQ